jgi:cytochrome c-type biogenesis protein CcmH/NrfG
MKKSTPSKKVTQKQVKIVRPPVKQAVREPWYAETALWLKIILVAFTFVLYGNTMKNGYSLDDLYVTYNNPVVNKGFKAIPQILSTRYINLNAEAGGTMNFGYRPLTKVMFAVEHQLFGEDPGISHFINILLYGLTLLLLFSILRRLMANYSIWFPFLITMLWAALPVHTEVVASLKNREEIISFLFGLLALQSYMTYVRKNSNISLVIGALWFLMSIFSKPSTLPLLAAIPFTIYFFTKANLKNLILITASMVLISLAALLFVKMYLPEINRPMLFFENPLAFEKNFLLHISTGMYGLLIYLKLLIYPHPLLFYYGYNTIPVVGLFNFWVILSIVLHIGLFVFAVMKLREKHILSFAILFYLIVISMYANIVKPPAGIIAERFLYIASIGFSIAVVYFIFKVLKVPFDKPDTGKQIPKVILVLLVILIPFTARTIIRNKDWNSQLSLFSHDIQYLNNSAKANFIYATTLKTDLIEGISKDGNRDGTEPKVEKIIGLLEQTVKVYPGYFEAWNSLGEMYAMMKNDYDKALSYFQKSTEAKATYAAAWFNLGYAYQQKDDFPKAIENYRKAVELDTMDAKAVSNLAFCLNKTGEMEEAVSLNKRIIRLRPQMELPYMNIAMYYYKQGDTANAIKSLEDLVRVKPGAKRATGLLNRYFSNTGDTVKAAYYRQLFEKAQDKQQ